MAATVYKLFTVFDWQPGWTYSFTWKNIPDVKAVAVDVKHWNVGSFQEGYTTTTEAEVTRFWRRRRQIESAGSIGVNVEVRWDVRGEVKNIGADSIDFEVYLIAFT